MQSGTIDKSKTAARGLERGEYKVNEIFHSIQGEGILTGTPMVFVRFSGCNLRCQAATTGFDCDTEFVSGDVVSADDVLMGALGALPEARFQHKYDRGYVLFTGGEPGLQLTAGLLSKFKNAGFKTAVETNGTIPLPKRGDGDVIDHICVSPKSAMHTLKQRSATEVKFVRRHGQQLPAPEDVPIHDVEHWLVSVACQPDGRFERRDVEWCLKLAKEMPGWRFTIQSHKLLRQR